MVSEDAVEQQAPRGRSALLPAGVAAVGVTVVFVASGLIRGTYPFGSLSRSTNDLGTQYVPFFAHLWDILHGQAQGDLLFNWQSAFGVGFWADLGVDLGSPLSLLVGLFPRDRVDLAVFVITTLKLSLAAAAMAAALLKMRPGPRWVAAMLGISYGVCGWALDDGSYVPMWLDGLIALPMFFLVAEWSLRRTNRVLSVLVVAVFWLSNFYTAYMATFAGGVYLLARLLSSDLSWSLRLRSVVRHGVSFVLGMGLIAPILLPIILANRAATPSPSGNFHPSSIGVFLSRLLPLTEGVGKTASLYVGTLALLLALTMPFNKFVPWRSKVIWVITIVGVALTFRWGPTQAFWHAFDTPNGSQYREAFVLCGLLVAAAWISVAHKLPGPLALLGGGALLALIAVVADGSPLLKARWLTALGVSGAVALVAFGTIWLLRRSPNTRRLRLPVAAAFAVLLAVVGLEATWSAVVTDEYRSKMLGASADPWSAKMTARYDELRKVGDWPKYRTEPGTSITPNDPMLLGGQGAGLYSSLLPYSVNQMMTGLGFGWSGYGRASRTLDNPVTDAIFSVGARMRLIDSNPHISKATVPPLVTVRRRLDPAIPTDTNAPNAYLAQERLLGSTVYEVPEYKGTRLATGDVKLVATCAPTSTAYLFMPRVGGRARLAGGGWLYLSATRRPGINTSSAMIKLGTVPKSGAVQVEVNFGEDPQGIPPHNAIGCFSPVALEKAVTTLRATGAKVVRTGGHSLHATLPAGSKGWAVIGVPKIDGWSCKAGGQAQAPSEFGGLMAVPLTNGATTVDCTFTPPGLSRGLAIAAAAAVLTLGIAGIGAVRRRRRATS
ncbi:putative membrane protein YfhO [Kribbella aluminosa]|uniref:Membrane protein YfhO n=1 Tax=Kribbella aluminosa TaxID=416017 RepID=A0ABS4UTB8_9ACTN|nr:YfhO family protein [Kribbella aluminosa]MBP2354878.1 putative membrane protein YfhO [Kribbella aluminosa]